MIVYYVHALFVLCLMPVTAYCKRCWVDFLLPSVIPFLHLFIYRWYQTDIRRGVFRLRSNFYCFQICPVLIFSHVVKERCMYVEPCAPEHTYISLVLSISISTVTVIYVPHSVSVFHNVFFIRICVNWLFTTLYMQKDSIIVYIVCRGNSKRF